MMIGSDEGQNESKIGSGSDHQTTPASEKISIQSLLAMVGSQGHISELGSYHGNMGEQVLDNAILNNLFHIDLNV
jgi:hypothetical protein